MAKSFRKSNRGFSVAELLIVVAILIVLMGVSFIAVVNYQRSMRQLEMDGIAKEIFIAAQNHLTMAEEQNYLGRTEFGAKELEDKNIYYFIVGGSGAGYTDPNDESSALNLMLPFASVDESVRLGGSYIVRYQKEPAQVLDVFYCARDGVRFGHTFTAGETEYNDLMLHYCGEENKGKRKNFSVDAYGADGAVLGWYGGTDAQLLGEIKTLQRPMLLIKNAERLEVQVYDPNSSVPGTSLQLIVTGQLSKKSVAIQIVVPVSNTPQAGTGVTMPNGTDSHWYSYVLDSVTEPGKHFSDQFSGFIPGEDISVKAVAYNNTAYSTIAESSTQVTNSLFDTGSTPTKALISNLRHLENLDKRISNLDEGNHQSSEDGSDLLNIEEAEQTSDLSWSDFTAKTGSAPVCAPFSGTSLSGAGKYVPVSPVDTLAYDGAGHRIEDVVVETEGSAGLFGDLSIPNTSVSDLDLVNFNIKSQVGSAGALAGTVSCSAITVSGVRVYNDDPSGDSGYKIDGVVSAGGLIGSMLGGAVQNSSAAVYVQSGTGAAGGLIGKAIGNTAGVDILCSYSGGHTQDGEYLTASSGAARINVVGGTAGGLIGEAISLSVQDSYSTCSAGGNVAGGLVGKASKDSVEGAKDNRFDNTYCTGLVSGSSVGAFAGSLADAVLTLDAEDKPTNSYYGAVNGDLPALGNGTTSDVAAFDADLSSYQEFVRTGESADPAQPYDAQLSLAYLGKYHLQTVSQLANNSYASKIHYGDWPVPEAMTVNTRVASVSNGGNSVQVFYGRDAALPEGTSVRLSAIAPGTESYENYRDEAAELLGVEPGKLENLQLVDISLCGGGAERQPEAPVSVLLRLPALADAGRLLAIHFGAEPELIPVESVDGTLRFETASFSTFAFLSALPTRTLSALTEKGDMLTLTCDDSARLPQDAEPGLRELTAEDEEYESYLKQIEELLGHKAEELQLVRLFAVSLRDAETGEELQPAREIGVRLELPELFLSEKLLAQLELPEEPEEEPEDAQADGAQPEQTSEELPAAEPAEEPEPVDTLNVIRLGASPELTAFDLLEHGAEFCTNELGVYAVVSSEPEVPEETRLYCVAGKRSVLLSEILQSLSYDIELNGVLIDREALSQLSVSALQGADGKTADWQIVVPEELPADEMLTLILRNKETLTVRVTDEEYEARIEDTPYLTLADALGHVSDGQTIVLLKDVTLTQALEVYFPGETGFTLDLNEKTLTVSAEDGISFGFARDDTNIVIQNGALNSKLSVSAGKVTLGNDLEAVGDITLSSKKKLELDGAVLIGDVSVSDANSILTLSSGLISGNVTVSNGTMTLAGGALVGNLSANYGTLTVNGGSVNGSVSVLGGSTMTFGGGSIGSSLTVDGGSSLTVDGGALDGDLTVSGGSTMTLTSGVIDGTVSATGGCTLTLGGGTVTQNVNTDACTTTISGGTVNGDLTILYGSTQISGGELGGNLSAAYVTDLTISGGEFEGEVSVVGGNTTITGGSFASQPVGEGIVINAVTLTITADSAAKEYDGAPLTKNSYTVSGTLAEGDSVDSVTVTGSQTEVGSSDNIPSGAVITNNSGTNYIIVYVKGTLTVSKATLLESDITAPAPIEGLFFTGLPQQLVTAGSTVHGTMKYSLDGTAYAEQLPTATAAGQYTVWYKVDGGDCYEDYGPYSVNARIWASNAQTVTVTVTNTARDPEQEFTYTARIKSTAYRASVRRTPQGVWESTQPARSDPTWQPAESFTLKNGESKSFTLTLVKPTAFVDSDAETELYASLQSLELTQNDQSGYTAEVTSVGGQVYGSSAVVDGWTGDLTVHTPDPNAASGDCYIDFTLASDPIVAFTNLRELTVTAESAEKEYDGTELTADGYTAEGLLGNDEVQSVTVTGSQTEIGSSPNVPDNAVIVDENGSDVSAEYSVIYINGTLTVTGPPIVITADSDEKTYDGEPLTAPGYSITEGTLKEGHSLQSVTVTGTQTNAGTSANVPSGAVIVDGGGSDVTNEYNVSYANGTLTVHPRGVVLRANCGTAKRNNGEEIRLGYTCVVDGEVVEGLVFEGVSVTPYTDTGMHTVSITGVTLGETTDTTGNYVVSNTVNGLIVIEGENPILTKTLLRVEGNLAYYRIVVNPDKLILTEDGGSYILKDTFSENQSINYGSVTASCDSEEISWDYSGYTGTFYVPDATEVTVEYFTRVKGDAGSVAEVTNTAELGKMLTGSFVTAAKATVAEELTLDPDVNGTGGVYTIGLYVYPSGHMETGLGGAAFRLLDENKRPMTYPSGPRAGEEITFTTSDGTGSEPRGCVTVGLDEATDGLRLHKNTVYYLEMTTAPYTVESGVYTYYQKDNTYYSFLITDEPNYQYGGVYSYFNGDVLKVRCYPQSGGVNVMKRFSGNYELTAEQKNAITFTLQKESLDSATGWIDIESHTYREFSYGAINFDILTKDLEDAATYRVVETNALPEELEGTIELNTAVSVTYQVNGEPVEDDSGEFLVDPDDKTQVSYSFVFTNEYVDHRLTVLKVDEMTGAMLQGAEFSVYAASDDAAPVKAYATGEDGRLFVRKSDSEDYAFNTLYYAAETAAPTGYILPPQPERIWFWFSEEGASTPEGLPAGQTATDLTASYNTVAILNRSTRTDVPVTVSWGLGRDTGADAWPDGVSSVVIGLYQSVDGAAPTPVTDAGGTPLTVTLTKAAYFDMTSFCGLPAQDAADRLITYSVVEEEVRDTNGQNVLASYAQSFSVSGTGWYIVNNRAAVSVTIQKQWYENDGATLVSDPSGKPPVILDLYRTAEDHAGDLTREELVYRLNGAAPVRTDLTLSNENNWTLTVPSLEQTDDAGAPWYYYALEHVPDNQIDSYSVTAATETEFRQLTVRNRQTPSTITITAHDLERLYGQPDPAFDLSAAVAEIDGTASTIEITGSDGSYTATVTRADNSTASFPFTVSREAGSDVGSYAITMTAEQAPVGYRVVFVPAVLTIKRAEVRIIAGGTKVYGDNVTPEDPESLVTIILNDEDVTATAQVSDFGCTAFREDLQDVGVYPITLSGETEQRNYHITFVQGSFTITPAPLTVKADDGQEKTYGEEDPEFTATVTGLKNHDDVSTVVFEMTREDGEDVGTYVITASGAAEQGNYTVSYESGTFTIHRAVLELRVDDAEKVYGDADPELWEVIPDNLQDADYGGSTVVSGGTYSYYKPGSNPESDAPILTYTISREPGENVGSYAVYPVGDVEQGNYTVAYQTGENAGRLTIVPAELSVIPNNMVKAKLEPAIPDPLLTATIDGWKNGDADEENTTVEYTANETDQIYTWTYTRDGAPVFTRTASVSEGVVTWTYTRGGVTILSFTLTRAAGEDEEEYEITASGTESQGNYVVSFPETGVFRILSMLNIEVSQQTEDPVSPAADPAYAYRAEVDLSGTGLSGEYNDNDFENGVLEFTLPQGGSDTKTLKVPAGARLTVTQLGATIPANDRGYTTAITLDGDPYPGSSSCTINGVDNYYAIRFTHNRITLPVQAMAAVGDTETGALSISGSNGSIGIPDEDFHVIDLSFVQAYQARCGYVLPTDKYYVYDHATMDLGGLFTAQGVTHLKYNDATSRWQYKTTYSAFNDVPDGAVLKLFYMPKYICKIVDENPVGEQEPNASGKFEHRFYTLNDALTYVGGLENKTATVEMLLADYPMPASDAVTIPAGYEITLTTAEEVGPAATVSRRAQFTGGVLFTNHGSLTLDNIILDGKDVAATACMLANMEDAATLTVNANVTVQNADGQNGGAIYVKSGTVTVAGSLTENHAVNGAAVYAAGGSVTVSGSVTGNSADHGGAFYVEGGTVAVSGAVSGNTATNGGAAYLTGGTLNVLEVETGTGAVTGAFTGNTASLGGAVYMSGGTLNVTGSLTGNAATASGGAVFLTGGMVNSGGSVSGNTAANGGAFYVEGGTVNVTAGSASNNVATGSGGLVYGTNGNVNITGADTVVSGNTAQSGNGGAICYGGGGAVTVSSGSVTGNTAGGNGGAIYLSAGTATLSGGTIGGSTENANTAVNGSAVFVADGAATFSGVSITCNTASNGGAVGVGSTTARLHFAGNTVVSDNVNSSISGSNKKCNVYLDQDSDLIINTPGLGSSANIGIYVSDAYLSTRGDACTQFGTYTTNTNIGKFKNDRSSVLEAYYNNYKLIWSRYIQLNVRYVSSLDALFSSSFSAKMDGTGTQKYPDKSGTGQKYYPTSQNNPIYDLTKKLCEDLYKAKVSGYVYAYTYVWGATQFENYLTDINWDSANQKWSFIQKKDGVYSDATAKTIIIYYSDAAYLSITNNSEHPVTIDPMTVMDQNVLTKNYGYPTVVNYLTQQTLIPLGDLADDPSTPETEPHVENGKLVIPAFGYVKLLFPGAVSKNWSMSGTFSGVSLGDTVNYTLDSLNTSTPKQPLKDGNGDQITAGADGNLSFTLSGTTLAKDKTYDILFEDPTPVCKIEDDNAAGDTDGEVNIRGKYEHAFSTLKDAWQYVVDHNMTEAKIEMLMDYLQPLADVLQLTGGHSVTLTTADPRGTPGVEHTYFGADPTRATISRDSDNDGAAVIAEIGSGNAWTTPEECGSFLTVTNLIFDGKALAKKGNGGAISTMNCIVTIRNCMFKGYEAQRGGAVFVAWGSLTVEDADFQNCVTGDTNDKTGGGAIWSTSKVLTVRNCSFNHCACESGKSQGGAIFHNINADKASVYNSAPSKFAKFPTGFYIGSRTVLENCHFTDCYAEGGSGGTIESDSEQTSLTGCTFLGSYSNKAKANGGALNILHKSAYVDAGVYSALAGTKLTLINCSFEHCQTQQANSNGGAILAANTAEVVIKGCTFKDISSDYGGAIKVPSKDSNVQILGSSFENCIGREQGGAIYMLARELTIGEYGSTDVNGDGKPDGDLNGDGDTEDEDDIPSTQGSSFKNCSSPQYGAVYQERNTAGSYARVSNTTFEDCVSSNSSAGALYSSALSLSITGQTDVPTFKSCTATKTGGAVYHIGNTETLTDCSFENCSSGDSGGGAYFVSTTFTATGGETKDCAAVNAGGGLYVNSSGTASITGCKFSGNTLSASSGKGGALYFAAGTVTLSGVSVGTSTAAYGGGVYQNNGTLNITDNSTVSGCTAETNGGGIYQNNGTMNFNSGIVENCTAETNGGGVYQNSGTMNFNGGTITDCKAAISGGGLYTKGKSYLGNKTNDTKLTISDCYAGTSGGGVYHTANLYPQNAEISGCCAKQGGGLYSAAYFEMKTEGYVLSITDCQAKDVTFNKDGTVSLAADFGEDNLGGGICFAADSSTDCYLKSSAVTISGCQAYSGGGFCFAAGRTMYYSAGSIIGNTAANNGGGFYQAGGALNMSGGTVGGSDDNRNTAARGAGVFVADGQTMTVSGGVVSYNRANTAGGGIAVGGSSAVLNFKSSPKVQYNTMSVLENGVSKTVECNVYLDLDSNAIINMTDNLGAGAYIGVYCSEEQNPKHGQSGMPFGTYVSNKNNIDRFRNDRNTYIYGAVGTNKQIIWCSFVCKITDGEGNLLYKDAAGTPAAYMKLENNDGAEKTNAFGTLANSSPGLYKKVGDSYTAYDGTGGYEVQMLVQDYQLEGQITLKKGFTVKLTTASAEKDECGLFYSGDQKHPFATIIRNADFGSMILLSTATPRFSMESVILDGGSENGFSSNSNGGILYVKSGSATIGADAMLRNSNVGGFNGGAVRLEAGSGVLTLDGGTISNCQSTAFGGGISVKYGTFVMNSGSITGCRGKDGGAVRLDTTMRMNGGVITGNNATNDGGGISAGNATAKLYFTGSPNVTENTLNGTTACNVQLSQDNNGVINASGLKSDAEIGVYVPGPVDPSASGYASGNFSKHGEEGDPFGTWSVDWATEDAEESDKPYCFVNDRNSLLRGSKGGDADKKIYWAQNFLLTIRTDVDSDLAADHTAIFNYTLTINSTAVRNKLFSDHRFNAEGTTTVSLRDGEAFTIYFPDSVRSAENQNEWAEYTVEVAYSGAQAEDFDTDVLQNEGTEHEYAYAHGVLRADGRLGENLYVVAAAPSGRSVVKLTHTRHTGALTVGKTVVSKNGEGEDASFPFTLELIDKVVGKTYQTKDGNGTTGEITFNDEGKATFTLGHNETLTVEGLPTDLNYKVSEDLSENPDAGRIRTRVSIDGGAETSDSFRSGKLGEHYVTGEGGKEYTSFVSFINNYLEIVCKITDTSGTLLYYEETDGNNKKQRVPAIYDSLANAFDRVNAGGLYRSKTTSNALSASNVEYHIKMVVPEYTMDRAATLSAGRRVTLTTASIADQDNYPLTGATADVTAAVTRGDFTESMITDGGKLTLDKITLDGGSTASTPLSATEDGGIVKVSGAVKLTVNDAATLQNSVSSANGGAIWLDSGAELTMGGTVKDCAAASGGGVYANTGFNKITHTGTISGCTATGDGGGICASTGGSITVNNGARLTGNTAENGNGGAICSNAALKLRGIVGGSEAGEGNTAENGSGGGVYMCSGTTFNIFATAQIAGNSAAEYGGGLYAAGATELVYACKINGNEALYGGGVYAADSATVRVKSAAFNGNTASVGGALYADVSVSMESGSMTANTASEKGGAVYVQDGKAFTMTGGSITGGNSSPEGAVSTGEGATLNFSGASVVTGNFLADGTTAANVYLGYDSNGVIRTTGLGSGANIGVYVANGENNDILYEHGIADRNFGTYTGSTPRTANFEKFHNDRDTELNGFEGDLQNEDVPNVYYVMWPGKNLYVKVLQQGNHALVSGAVFTLTRIKVGESTEVWSGRSNNSGVATVPWSKFEATGNNYAIFARNSYYVLEQKATNSACVLPAGKWLIHVQDGNEVVWYTLQPWQDVSVDESGVVTAAPVDKPDSLQPEVEKVNRTLDITKEGEGTAVLGDTFLLYNDRRPTVTFYPNGGRLSGETDKAKTRTRSVSFGSATSASYTVDEPDPKSNTIFRGWNTEIDGSGVTYRRGDSIKFYRDSDDDDLNLYAQWDPVVCKITDEHGTLLYVDGAPAVYATLEAGVLDFTAEKNFKDANGKTAKARYIKMLVDTYTLTNPITLKGGTNPITGDSGYYYYTRLAFLTTASRNDKDDYPFYSADEDVTVCTIVRSFADKDKDKSMITCNSFNLRLSNITLDGGGEAQTATANGGLVSVDHGTYSLTVAEGTTLRNSWTTGLGGAIYAAAPSKVILNGGTTEKDAIVIENNHAAVSASGTASATPPGLTDGTAATTGTGKEGEGGAGIYLAEGGSVSVRGRLIFRDNTIKLDGYEDKTNGGDPEAYKDDLVRQDIYIAGYDKVDGNENPAESLTVNGELLGASGSIWVWAEYYHGLEEQQFAVYSTKDAPGGLSVLRNAKPDATTSGEVRSSFLCGVSKENDGFVYWGTEGMDVSFDKRNGIGNGTGASKVDAEFTLYKADKTTQVDTASPEIPEGGSVPTVTFKKVPNGIYYLKETQAAVINGKEYKNTNTYIVLVGSGNLTNTGTGLWADGEVLAGITTEAAAAEAARNRSKYGDDRRFAIFLIDRTDPDDPESKAAVAEPSVAGFGILNESTKTHRVLLRKVSDTFTSLEGAQFRIFRSDMTEVKAPCYDKVKRCYVSMSSGVYFVGDLPEGTYYIVEIKSPYGSTEDPDLTNTGKVFELTVDENGKTQKVLLGEQPPDDGTTLEQFLYSIGHPEP